VVTHSAPRVRRAYFECRFGQLHVHNAVPPGGGFDELTTVICLHGAGETGRVFVPLLQVLGASRSVFAPDLPGCGESDPGRNVDAITAGAQAVEDFVHSMRIRSYDLVARASGCDIARRLASLPDAGPRRVALITDHGQPAGQRTGLGARLVASLSAADAQMPALGTRLIEALRG
jgi:pimeloyl-ACP methyl ester carboxylesterase